MRLIYGLALLPFLAACSEQQICISNATKDLRTVRGFLSETEGNLARGYAIVKVEYIEYENVQCGVNPDDSPQYCFLPIEKVRDEKVAFDFDAEVAKRDALRRKEATLARQAERDIAACKAEFPEG